MVPSTTRPRTLGAQRYAAPPALLAALTLLAAGCTPATHSDPEFWAPHAGDTSGGEPEPEPSGPSSTSTTSGGSTTPTPADTLLTLSFTTATVGGEYEPENVGAVWVTDAQDTFVKTLEVWAGKRDEHLIKWQSASAGHDVVDAITRATRHTHVAHQSLWNGTDNGGQTVPDGAYRIYVEFTEDNSSEGEPAGPWMSIDFTKGSAPEERAVPDQRNFAGIHLSLTP
ncbi:DUF2271 domain-containing protein [Chondromyces apiculatus]|uniref:DUF2271 domain-containing protein n=1 Tax=Chondromyces apiculatus DSM 436 TaxID=1192034 RepID=A0A017T1E7_9BACT|nr:DUF2271 domain-containing protein [Chondromyces apiculatus]EYF02832.1 Hypothetical protein CAP_6412 [Chondromyces apiculatus DSM 436]